MENKILELIKEKPIVAPKILFNNYRKLNITDSELIIIIYMMNIGDKIIYNPEMFVSELNLDKYKVMELINSLLEKNIIELLIEKNNNSRVEEYLSLNTLYNKIYNLLLNKESKSEEDVSNIFSIFEQEFGRTLSPMEYEIIEGWLDDNISFELIIEALKESVYNGVNSLRYIEKILLDWKKKGYKNKSDIIKNKDRFKKSNTAKEVFDYNWLEDE